MDRKELQNMKTDQLRRLVREMGFSGERVNYWKKAKLISVLTGEDPDSPDMKDGFDPRDMDLADIMARIMSDRIKAGVDPEEVKGIAEAVVDQKLKSFNPAVREIELIAPDRPAVKVGMQHREFERILKLVALPHRHLPGRTCGVRGKRLLTKICRESPGPSLLYAARWTPDHQERSAWIQGRQRDLRPFAPSGSIRKRRGLLNG